MISIDRREFAKMISIGLCSACISSLLNSCEFIDERLVPEQVKQNRKIELNITEYPELQIVGKAHAMSVKEITGGIKLIFLRMKEIGKDAFLIMSTICPHGGYFISIPDAPGQNYHCNEHNSEYDYYTGEMRHPPDVDSEFKAHLIKFKSEYNEENNSLTIFY